MNIENHILVNWKRTQTYDNKSADLKLFNIENSLTEKEILSVFEKEWNVVVCDMENGEYSVKFRSNTEYINFKEFALKFSKPYYIFEGDVLDFIIMIL